MHALALSAARRWFLPGSAYHPDGDAKAAEVLTPGAVPWSGLCWGGVPGGVNSNCSAETGQCGLSSLGLLIFLTCAWQSDSLKLLGGLITYF